MTERTFVLVHGSFQGSWAWDSVRVELERAEHAVEAPDLALDPGTGLADHATATLALVASLDAERITVVGHSYGCMLLATLAAAEPRIDTCVYLDGFVPADGETAFDLLGPMGEQLRELAEADTAGCFPPPPPEAFGVTDATIAALLTERLRPMPAETHAEAAGRPAIGGEPVDREPWRSVYVRFTQLPMFEAHEQRAADAGWTIGHVDADHMGPLTAPGAVAAALLETT